MDLGRGGRWLSISHPFRRCQSPVRRKTWRDGSWRGCWESSPDLKRNTSKSPTGCEPGSRLPGPAAHHLYGLSMRLDKENPSPGKALSCHTEPALPLSLGILFCKNIHFLMFKVILIWFWFFLPVERRKGKGATSSAASSLKQESSVAKEMPVSHPMQLLRDAQILYGQHLNFFLMWYMSELSTITKKRLL